MAKKNLPLSSITRVLLVVGILALGTSLNLGDAHCGEMAGQSSGNCSFAEELKDSNNRSDYLELLTQLRQRVVTPVQYYSESMYQEIARADSPRMRSYGLDPISYQCVSCHDGSIAPATRYSHPVGIEYPMYSTYISHFVSRGALNRRIILIDGKVGCLSCHNPLNPGRNHLVMSNDRSRLCLSCHMK